MSYATLADVNGLCRQVPFTATSKPSDADVTGFLDDVSSLMDASLSSVGYVTPVVAGPIALKLLRKICREGGLGLAQYARDTGVSTSVSASGREGKNIWTQLYEQQMKALCDGNDPFELTDAPRTGEQLEKQPENVLRSSVQSVPDDNWLNPTVTREQIL